ncbi:hypothetical protein [Streptomyces qinzhouensis]|uniref:Uncharacterized protein n=1 Tax=Streptomyces qinzhouensis TaxID=2599401 RepID=A0A5B8IMW4_9ACTN|nr:hypothetical protein [Streptomyces qinzhouensis]QDY79968.1 hypothetical protein FQU76_29325 [Streptomyces qinzhouensis]
MAAGRGPGGRPPPLRAGGRGTPEPFLAHAERGEVLADIGPTPVETADRISAVPAAKENPAP